MYNKYKDMTAEQIDKEIERKQKLLDDLKIFKSSKEIVWKGASKEEMKEASVPSYSKCAF